MNWYVISYDISNNKVRRDIQKICSGYLHRIQYSVFEGELQTLKGNELKKKLTAVTRTEKWKKDSDSILIFKFCSGCREQAEFLGSSKPLSTKYIII